MRDPEKLAMMFHEALERIAWEVVGVHAEDVHDEERLTWRRVREALAADVPAAPDPEALAQRFHEAYERLAPSFSYETRTASAKPWAAVPENNRRLMIAVCAEILETLDGELG